jgi:hypothetical protein
MKALGVVRWNALLPVDALVHAKFDFVARNPVLGRDMTASNANLVAVVRLFTLMVDACFRRILERSKMCETNIYRCQLV